MPMDSSSSQSTKLDAPTILSIQRTELALESSLMTIDKTEMSVLTTSLSLIGFGFTIFKFFQEAVPKAAVAGAMGPPSRNFGLFLVILGILLLIAGQYNRFRDVRALNRRWRGLHSEGLIFSAPGKSISPNMIVSVLLALGGALVLLGIAAHIGPFG
jgi:inner membrane protein YidH